MKAITIKQPWAHLICAGIKSIENRTWRPNFRGQILIHASASPVKAETFGAIFSSEQMWQLSYIGLDFGSIFKGGDKVCSAIIGSVRIVDSVQNYPSVWAEKGVWNWVLDKPVLFANPILEVKGKLSFWEYEKLFECGGCGGIFDIDRIGRNGGCFMCDPEPFRK